VITLLVLAVAVDAAVTLTAALCCALALR